MINYIPTYYMNIIIINSCLLTVCVSDKFKCGKKTDDD